MFLTGSEALILCGLVGDAHDSIWGMLSGTTVGGCAGASPVSGAPSTSPMLAQPLRGLSASDAPALLPSACYTKPHISTKLLMEAICELRQGAKEKGSSNCLVSKEWSQAYCLAYSSCSCVWPGT